MSNKYTHFASLTSSANILKVKFAPLFSFDVNCLHSLLIFCSFFSIYVYFPLIYVSLFNFKLLKFPFFNLNYKKRYHFTFITPKKQKPLPWTGSGTVQSRQSWVPERGLNLLFTFQRHVCLKEFLWHSISIHIRVCGGGETPAGVSPTSLMSGVFSL